jgi:hypothetical protein
MQIERCLVVDCRVYTKFVGNRTVVVDVFDTFERAMDERKTLMHLNALYYGQAERAHG